MSVQYTEHFVRVHKQLSPSIPIHRFAEHANPLALGVGSKKDFFAPIRFNVQACGSIAQPGGTIRMDVPVHANTAWYADLKQKLAGTLGLTGASFIELRTVTGKPLNEVEVAKLQYVGNLNVYVDGKQKRFAAMPSVPVEYSVTKRQELRKWQLEAMRDLPHKVADELHRKNAVQVDAAIRVDGSVQKLIEAHLVKSTPKSMPWPEFVRVFNINSPKVANASDADVVLRNVSTSMLEFVRSFVGASKDRINKHIASVEAQQLSANGAKKHVAPVLGVSLSAGVGENGHEMYSNLIEHALQSPALERAVLDTLFMSAPASMMKRRAELVPVRKIATHHPWYGQIHSLLPVRGTYPSNYIVGHTKRDMSVNAPYLAGDMIKTYRAYHLFSGQHLAPPSMVVTAIGCGAMKKRSSKKKSKPSKKSESVDVEQHHSSRNTGARRRRPTGRGSEDVGEDHPGIIPLDRLYISVSEEESASSSQSDSDIDAYIVPIKSKPKTSRIAAEEEDEVVDMEQVDEFAHLPSVDDIFK